MLSKPEHKISKAHWLEDDVKYFASINTLITLKSNKSVQDITWADFCELSDTQIEEIFDKNNSVKKKISADSILALRQSIVSYHLWKLPLFTKIPLFDDDSQSIPLNHLQKTLVEDDVWLHSESTTPKKWLEFEKALLTKNQEGINNLIAFLQDTFEQSRSLCGNTYNEKDDSVSSLMYTICKDQYFYRIERANLKPHDNPVYLILQRFDTLVAGKNVSIVVSAYGLEPEDHYIKGSTAMFTSDQKDKVISIIKELSYMVWFDIDKTPFIAYEGDCIDDCKNYISRISAQ